MLTDMTMLSGGIRKSFGDLLEGPGYELRVSPRGTLPFDTEATIRDFADVEGSITGMAGVRDVAPILAASLTVERAWAPGGSSESDAAPAQSLQSLAMGVRDSDGGLFRLTAGQAPEAGEVVVSDALAQGLDIDLGDALRLQPSRGFGGWSRTLTARISGTALFPFAARGDAPLAMALADLQTLMNQANEVSFAMVAVAPAADPEAVARDIVSAVRRVDAVTLGGVGERLDQRLSYFRQLAVILGTVSLVVTALLVGTLAAVSISERRPLLAALRAIGVPQLRIMAELAAESLVVCATSSAVGLGLGLILATRLEVILGDFPGLPVGVRFFVADPVALGWAVLLLMACGAASAAVPAWTALRSEAATLLHRGGP